MSDRLIRLATVDVPVVEASGVATAQDAGGTTYVAVAGDRTAEVAWAPVVGDAIGEWSRLDLASTPGWPFAVGQSSQFEAVAVDGHRRLVVMCEEPAVVLVVDPAAGAVTATIRLVVGPSSPVHRAWQDRSSRGEGVVLLRDGRLLVAKEKRPAALLLFGPLGDTGGGVDRGDLLRPGERWAGPDSDEEYHLLACWLLAGAAADTVRDISDLALDPAGGLWLLSDQSAVVARVAWPLGPDERPVTVLERARRLPKHASKAEGLAWLAPRRVVVVMDQPTGHAAGWVLAGPDEEG
jgi:hypothetical protein